MNTYRIIWGPTGQEVAIVQARNPRSAIRKTPRPWVRYLGELRAELISKQT